MRKRLFRRRPRYGLRAMIGLLVAAVIAAGAAFALRDRIPFYRQVSLRALFAGISIDREVLVTMPDGVRLAVSIYRPRGADGPLPTLLVRLPYDRTRYSEALRAALFYPRHGYAVVIEDVRGTAGSEGKDFVPWRHATADGAATLDWILSQPWSNGRIGTLGCSALGELQFALARAQHPAHLAMVASGAGGGIGSAQGSYEYFGLFEGGIFQLASGFGWLVAHGSHDPATPPPSAFDLKTTLRQLPIVDLVKRVRPGANAYEDFLRTPLDDPRWQDLDYVGPSDRLTTPSLSINTWGDQTLGGTLALAKIMRAQSPQGGPARHHVILAPGAHCEHAEIANSGAFGEMQLHNTSQPYNELSLELFDYWLRGVGDGLSGMPAYTYYVIGEDRWLASSRWPPDGSRTQRWYLGSGGHANTRDGDGTLSASPSDAASFDEYAYDPADPVPSRGGPVCCTGDDSDRSGPVDQSEVDSRNDVLVYRSPPLEKALRIAGPLRAHLLVSSTAPDTDFIARLVHIWPDGHATNIQEGALRARYRKGIASPELMTPEQVYELTVDMRSIAYLLPKGHRFALHLTSSSFPRLERNLNTGGRNYDESVGVIARNRIHHGAGMSSYVEVPVLDTPTP